MVPPLGLSLYDWALLLYLPTFLIGGLFDLRSRTVPLLLNIPAAIGAGILIYTIGTDKVPAIDPWIVWLLIIQMVAVGTAGSIIWLKGYTGAEDVIGVTLLCATLGGITIIVMASILTFIHTIARKLTGRNDNPYHHLYRHYPSPFILWIGLAYCVWLFVTFTGI